MAHCILLSACGSAAQGVASGEAFTDERGTPTPVEAMVTILFSLAIGALTITTAGVAYLAFSSWLDTQQDNRDLKSFESSVKT